jgi:hypothetical protein
MIQPKVTMLLSNPFRPDLRVQREAQSLFHLGYSVRIIAWDRMAELAAQQEDEGIEIKRIQHIRSVYYGGLRQLLVMPLFWRSARLCDKIRLTSFIATILTLYMPG